MSNQPAVMSELPIPYDLQRTSKEPYIEENPRDATTAQTISRQFRITYARYLLLVTIQSSFLKYLYSVKTYNEPQEGHTSNDIYLL